MPRSFTKRSNAGLAIAAAGVLLLQAGRGWAQTQKPSSLTTLTSAQQVRVLSPDEANRGYPVHIRAVVTYCDPAQQDFFVQDGTAGIYIDDPGLKTAFAPGDLLEIDGISEDLDFAPQIGKPHYKSLGHAALPEPRPASFDALMSTREDSQFVQFEGVVRNATLLANRITLDVVGGGGHLSATILNPETLTPARLVDAKVRLRGVCGGIYNQKKQLTGVQLAVPGAAQVSVLDRPPLDPFRLPVRPLSNLMIFTPQGDTEHRIRVQGTVTLQRPKGLFIQSGAQGLFIPGPQGATLTPGQRLDVVGFADIGDYTPVLQHPLIRPIGSAPLPGAISVGAKDVLARALDATRVSLEGTLREERRSETDQELVLDDGGVLFETRIDRSKVRKGWPGLPPGSRVRVTGVCSVTADRDRVPTGFDILLDSPSELAVLARPSWWTLRNTLASLALLAVITLGVLAWVGVLRRQVHLSRERAQILFSANPHPAYVLDLETLDFL
ncbi:MAG TPA: hypothetical protein VGZ29_15785, partial [Terriglobia bacterium]|nr:hypothetical protein [Terriglobia bacterium]